MKNTKKLARIFSLIVSSTMGFSGIGNAETPEKVKQLEDSESHVSLAQELMSQPDGVLRVRTNDDGSFKSLVVKASVEIEDVLGPAKGKQLARREAETRCKAMLSRFLEEHCAFAETSNETTTIVTKGENVKDAAGNTIKLGSTKGEEVKILTDTSMSMSNATLKGLIALHSEISEDQELVLIMGLNQDTLDSSRAVANALADRDAPPSSSGSAPKKEDSDGGVPLEKKTNPALNGF